MSRKGKSFALYARETQHENFAQFKGKNYVDGRTFVIAVADASVLKRALNCTIGLNPGYEESESVIVTRQNDHKELWTNPRLDNYRDTHLSFFKAIGIDLPRSIASGSDSDHAFPKSASDSGVGLVRMNFIPLGGNRSFGGAFEGRFRHRTLDANGLAMGNLFDLYKSVGGRFLLPRNPAGFGRAIVDDLIIRGLAPASDRASLEKEAQAVMGYIQDQDTNFAVRDGQIDLRPGKPLVPR